jgi:hypothetical protein
MKVKGGRMKIRILTEREFPDNDWDFYVQSMKKIGSPITDEQYAQLYKTGLLVIDHRNYDAAITTYLLFSCHLGHHKWIDGRCSECGKFLKTGGPK